jgi:hypothetical protein
MVIGFFENNRFEENNLTMASTLTGYCRAALPHVNPPAGYAYVAEPKGYHGCQSDSPLRFKPVL